MMKSTNAFWVIPVGLCLLLGARSGQARAQAPAFLLWPAADLKWSEHPRIKGAKVAVLWGDPATGPYGALRTFPGGLHLPTHTHTYDFKAVILAGTLVIAMDGGPSKELGPGSYAFVAGGPGHPHIIDCKAGAACVYFEERPGKNDIKYVERQAPSR